MGLSDDFGRSLKMRPRELYSQNEAECFVPGVSTGTSGAATCSTCVPLLGDTAAVTALLDRSLHHAHVLKCGPRSWRTKVQTELRTDEGTK